MKAIQYLEEAKQLQSSPREFRFLFVQVVLNLPCTARDLFHSYQEELFRDYMDLGLPARTVLQRGLVDLSTLFHAGGSNLRDFALPEPEAAQRSNERELEEDFFTPELKARYFEQSEHMYQTLTREQQTIFDIIYQAVTSTGPAPTNHCLPQLFFIDGKAGRGKTYLLNCLIMRLRSEHRSVAVCGSTALSATLYPRGRTAHSLFGIPVREDNNEIHSRINPSSD